MEYSNGGELFDFIVRNTRLNEVQASKFYWELIGGIEYLHKSGVCHRDLKPENLLLDYDNTLKIVDFGLSNMYEKNETLKTACGSPCYAAPEVSASFNAEDDCWEKVPRSAVGHLELRRCILRNGRWLFAFRRSKNLESLQKNHGSRLPNAQVFECRVQRLHQQNFEHRP